jgi:Rrf2 family protein
MSFFAVSGRRLGISHNLPLAHCRCSYEMGTIRLLTNKGKYGLKALVHLAGLAEGETAQAIEIATTNHIPKKFLDAILRDLKIAGLVAAKKGPGGGYRLAHPADDIIVGKAIRALDGPLAPIACASRTAYQPCEDCRDIDACAVRITMLEVRDAIAEVLDRISVADMRQRQLLQAKRAARKVAVG